MTTGKYSSNQNVTKMKKTIYFLFLLTIINCQNLFAQASCSIDEVTSLGQCTGSAINLEAKISGTLANIPNAIQWSQVSGIAVTIKNDNDAKALIAPVLNSGIFSFKVTAQCAQGGTIEKTINHTVFSKPNAGKDSVACEYSLILYGRPGFPKSSSGLQWISAASNPTTTPADISSFGPNDIYIGGMDKPGDYFFF